MMICEKCIYKKIRTQDGGRKVRCQSLALDLGFSQSINDPSFPMIWISKITECDCFEKEKDIEEKLHDAVKEIITNTDIWDDKKENNHPFGV